MKSRITLVTCGTSALFAAALGLHAQGSTSATGSSPTTGSSANSSFSTPQSSTTPSTGSSSSMGSASYGTDPSGTATMPSTSSTPSTAPGASGSAGISSTPAAPGDSSSIYGSSSAATNPGSTGTAGAPTGGPSLYGNSGTTPGSGMSSSTSSTSGSSAGAASSGSMTSSGSFFGTSSTSTSSSSSMYPGTSSSTQSGSISSTQPAAGGGGTTTNSFVANLQNDAQVTTVVQQLDAQGPAVVQRVESQLGGLACSSDTAQKLVEALHSGQSVTLASDAGGQTQSATLNTNGTQLGYGEAYIALALAAEQLRNAGVTSCATADQWKAALLGGPLTATTSSSTTTASTSGTSTSGSGSNQLPGILTLRSQGQGWGQIAQSANVQLGQIIANATNSASSTSGNLSPTGYSSSQMSEARGGASTSTSSVGTTNSSMRPEAGTRTDEDMGHPTPGSQPDDQDAKSSTPMPDDTNPANSPKPNDQ